MIFRIILGLYLTIHFAQSIPYAEELYGTKMPYDYKLNPTYGKFPNLLENMNATFFVVILTIMSVMLMFEICPRIVAFALWYGSVALLNRNVLILNPGVPYINWTLLALTLVDLAIRVLFQTDNRFLKKIQHDKFPKRIFWSAQLLLMAGYTYSGIHKLNTSPSWVDGTALSHVLNSPLARDNFLRDIIVQYPTLLKYGTWFSLTLEISALPFGVFYHTRFWFWMAYMFFHLGILMLINFTDLTVGVIMFHLFIFDWEWTTPINEYIAKKKQEKMQKYNKIN